MKIKDPDALLTPKRIAIENADPDHDEALESVSLGKSKVECLCPSCGKLHIMKVYWTGRGIPRKFCQSCRDRETPFDEDG